MSSPDHFRCMNIIISYRNARIPRLSLRHAAANDRFEVARQRDIQENVDTIMNPEIASLLAQGFTLVTPTGRLSRYLQQQYAALQILGGKQAWETPDILPWHGWLKRTWEEISIRGTVTGVLLTSEQQQHVWQDIISRSNTNGLLLHPVNTAWQAMQAWSLCQQWQIPVFPEDVFLNEDAYAFKNWANEYQQRCRANGWVDETVFASLLLREPSDSILNGGLVLIGFDDFTPQQCALLEHLQQSGCQQVIEYPLVNRSNKTATLGFTDFRAEIRAAATWAKKILEEKPVASIGIIVHNLHTLHSHITNCFNDILFPGSILVNSDQMQRPYNISLGLPLIRYPVIDAAMLILAMGHQVLPLEELSSLLRSPFIKGALSESQKRAKFDAFLRSNAEFKITFSSLLRFSSIERATSTVPDIFISCCRDFRKVLQESGGNLTPGEWAKLFSELLKTFNWPGDRPLNSPEYQTVTEWQALLGRFAALDLVSPSLSYRDALSNLHRLLITTGFQPQTPEVPIQVLGLNGAAGMQFDHLWVMGLHEEVWPPRAQASPFIPLELQRSANMPDASAELKLAQTMKFTDRLIQSSPDVVLGFPLNDGERRLRPSALIRSYINPEQEFADIKSMDYAEILFASGESEIIEDNRAPAIPAGETVSGGTTLFRDLAACPFRAFARHRLHADGLDYKDIGLDARDRGNIVHGVMQKLWSRLGSHTALLGMNRHELDTLTSDVISGTINEFRDKYPLAFTERFSRLEFERLQTLVNQWLELERQRRPFSVVQCEFMHKFDFNDIEIRTRIDRIDVLADGRYVIIDYKTGDPTLMAWFGDRPDDPQLPLYTISTDGEIAAVVFARIRSGDSAYIGLSETEGILPGVNTIADTKGIRDIIPDWETMISTWSSSLNRLAAGYREGFAVVDPKNSNTCKNCDLHCLCRIYEKSGTAVNGE